MNKVSARAPSTDNVLLKITSITPVFLRSIYKVVTKDVDAKHIGTFSTAVLCEDHALGTAVAFEGSIKIDDMQYKLRLVIAPTSDEADKALEDNDAILANEDYVICMHVKNKAFIPRKHHDGSKRVVDFDSSYASSTEVINTANNLSLAISKSIVSESLARLIKTNESNRKLGLN
jgi:hypothetical protein